MVLLHTWGEGRLKEDSWTYSVLQALCKKYKFNLNTPIKDLDKKIEDMLLYGTGGRKAKS